MAPVTVGRPVWARRAVSSMLVVGTADDVADLAALTRHNPGVGWRVIGACTSTGTGPDGAVDIAGVPVVGDLDAVAAAARDLGVDAVTIHPTAGWSTVRLQHLARELDFTPTALLVDPRLMPPAGPGVRASDVYGLPVLRRLTNPTLAGRRRFAKAAVDRTAALLLLLVLAPVLLGCGLAVSRDGGPALERRPRIGRSGRIVDMLAFRTTAVGSPVTTPVGRLLRKTCLDALPQLFNVLGGSMALVGPRPPTPAEVGRTAHLRVKPGITGLWQIFGRERLSADETEGLHRFYAESWSPVLDSRILLETLRLALRNPTR